MIEKLGGSLTCVINPPSEDYPRQLTDQASITPTYMICDKAELVGEYQFHKWAESRLPAQTV